MYIENINDFNNYENIYNLLNKYQKNKINKLKNIYDKKLSLLSLYLISKLSNEEIKNIKYIKGKPIIKNKYISVSHKYPYVVVIISNNKVGIDIEKIDDIKPSLMKYLNTTNNLNTIIKLTKIESYFKCYGIKEYNNFTNAKFRTYKIDNKYILTICK